MSIDVTVKYSDSDSDMFTAWFNFHPHTQCWKIILSKRSLLKTKGCNLRCMVKVVSRTKNAFRLNLQGLGTGVLR